ncbi:MAG: oligosaccharide flippase family protein [Bacteroidales bacterium]|nr:oligosaccharide flippase family protein [Bacteroidales bacterium]
MKDYYFNLIEKLKNNLFFQNVAIVASGSLLARIIGFFTAPIITRLYLPEDYGVLSTYAAIIGIIITIASLRYEVTIPLPEKENKAISLLKLSFLITVGLSAFFSFLIILWGDFIAQQLSLTHVKSFIWVIPTAFFGAGIYNALSSWATRHKLFKVITRTNISQSLASRAVKIGFGFLGVTPLGLLLGLITEQTAGVLLLFRKLLNKTPEFFKSFNRNEIIDVAKKYKNFPIYQSWSQLLLGFGTHLPVIMIASIYGIQVVGLYGLAHSMVNMPMSILGQAVSKVYYAEISRYGKNNPEAIYKLTISIMKKLFYFAIPPIIVLILWGPWLFSFIFGESWFDAGLYAKALSFIILFRLVSSPIMHCLNVLEKQKVQLIFNIVRVFLVFLLFFISMKLGINSTSAIWLYSVAMSGFFFFIMIYILSMIREKKAYE